MKTRKHTKIDNYSFACGRSEGYAAGLAAGRNDIKLIAAAPRMIELLKDAFIDVDSEILGEEWNKEAEALLLSVYGKIEW